MISGRKDARAKTTTLHLQRLTSEEAEAPRHLTHHVLRHPSAFGASPRLGPSPRLVPPYLQHGHADCPACPSRQGQLATPTGPGGYWLCSVEGGNRPESARVPRWMHAPPPDAVHS